MQNASERKLGLALPGTEATEDHRFLSYHHRQGEPLRPATYDTTSKLKVPMKHGVLPGPLRNKYGGCPERTKDAT